MASSLLSERPPPPNSAAALSAPPSSGGSSADVLRTAREAAARGDHAAALQHYSKVTGTGSSSQLLREVAQCARAAKRPQKAVELLRLALVTEPNTPELHSLLGEVYACAGMLSSAKSAFARALELKPNDDNCKLWLKRIERGDVH
jgi:Flp pilus assembly protein TadD